MQQCDARAQSMCHASDLSAEAFKAKGEGWHPFWGLDASLRWDDRRVGKRKFSEIINQYPLFAAGLLFSTLHLKTTAIALQLVTQMNTICPRT